MHYLQDLAEAEALALAVVDATIDPFVVLDEHVRVVAASRSFYQTFAVEPGSAHGKTFFDVSGGAWGIPVLRALLANLVPNHENIDSFEVSINFEATGERTLVLNARAVASKSGANSTTLLVIKDITARRQVEIEKQDLLRATEDLLRQQYNLIEEMRHRVANSLQIIASILMLKAKGVSSQEARGHLLDAHQRVMSVAEVQAHLHCSAGVAQINARDYLTKLCHGLSSSMTGPTNPIFIEAKVANVPVSSSRAVSMGLIVTELVINAIKYAFPLEYPGANITVTFEGAGPTWRLEVADNGIGNHAPSSNNGSGLGTAIVTALAEQLGGRLSTVSDAGGLTISLAGNQDCATLPLAA